VWASAWVKEDAPVHAYVHDARCACLNIRTKVLLTGSTSPLPRAQGKFDSDGAMRGSFDVLCGRSSQIACASRARAATMASGFEAPLKEMARTIKCVQATMADRAAALGQLHQVGAHACMRAGVCCVHVCV